tara:strand:+ start:6906 stop:8969 length:2064 start_codon:yes stop_codon:yes gene_type:complete
MSLNLSDLKGVGEKITEKLLRIGVKEVEDLLFHLPIKYHDKTKITKISELEEKKLLQICVKIEKVNVVFYRRRMLIIKAADETGSIQIRFFHFNRDQIKSFKEGKYIKCFGELKLTKNIKEFIHPEYRIIDDPKGLILDDTYTPIYPVTDGLRQASIRKLIKQAIKLLYEKKILLKEVLPEKILEEYKLEDIEKSLVKIHIPEKYDDINKFNNSISKYRRRLIFEELLAHQLSFRRIKIYNNNLRSFQINRNDELNSRLISKIPFKLTKAQENVIGEINHDMSKGSPMLRLVQGDVGSGKTIVALFAALHVIKENYQVAFMAPTEILAIQHYQYVKQLFKSFDVKVSLLYGNMSSKEKEVIREDIRLGNINFLVGTHALIQSEVDFLNLAFVIVDEQHKFGVHQRMSLSSKGKYKDKFPHQLILTATPIPRTLAMTLYGHLEYSIIDEMPKGRKPIDTKAICEDRRDEIIEKIKIACANGSQVYWVCPLIEESDLLECKAAVKTYNDLRNALPDINLGLLHGRMKLKEKELVMDDFRNKKINLLISTTIIEVGLDVTNATIIVIENAERMGLSQLHQLRGRVGRGKDKSTCILLYKSGLSDIAYSRINILRKSVNGFEIAKEDLNIRGPGELLGKRQKGAISYKIANIAEDYKLIPEVTKCSEQIPENIAELLGKRWIINKVEIGNA